MRGRLAWRALPSEHRQPARCDARSHTVAPVTRFETQELHLPAFEEDTVLLGRMALALAAHFPEWVRRRTTTFTFVDEKAYVQRLAVNMRLPSEAWFKRGKGADLARMLTSARPPETIYVPLNIVEKGTLAALDIVDGDDNKVAMRNRIERTRLTVDGFSALADEYAGDRGLERPSGWFRGQIEAVIAAPTPACGRRALRIAMSGDLGTILQDADPYTRLLAELANGTMMLVAVSFGPADRLWYVSWTERYHWSSVRRAGGRLRVAVSSGGWVAKRLYFPARRIGWAQSTHFVVHEPADAHNFHTALVEEPGDGEPPPDVPPRHEVWARPHADVWVSLDDPARSLAAMDDYARVEISLGPRRSAAFGAVTVVSLVSAALLFMIWRHLGEIDLEASTTVAVVLPALVAASLIRQNEHAVAGVLLSGVRVCGLLVMRLVFAAAGAIAATDLRGARDAVPTATCETVRAGSIGARDIDGSSGLLALPTPGPRPGLLVCSIENVLPSERTPSAGERIVVLVALIATSVIAVIVGGGMLATTVRLGRARRRTRPQRDGKAVG